MTLSEHFKKTYDAVGHRLTMVDQTGTTSYSYNGLDYLTGVKQAPAGGTATQITYDYDYLGRRTSLTTDNGAPALHYTYDDAGRLKTLQRGSDTNYAYANYDDAGRLYNITRGGNLLTTYNYDGADRLQDIDVVRTAPGNGPGPKDGAE